VSRAPLASTVGLIGLVAVLPLSMASAYGPAGHRIAGEVAAPLLCARAAREVERLGGGADLGEIGLWADQIRSDPAYADAAAWHYVNVVDRDTLVALEHPPEGDVLWAIGHFAARLGDSSANDAVRAEALKFLVHFVVDLHQPIHVGLADDRGGNDVPLRFRGELTNLHRFWDTHAIEQAGLSLPEYAQSLRELLSEIEGAAEADPTEWAAESLALRPIVYGFGPVGQEPDTAYLERAAEVTQMRLAQASLRLAGTLNRLFCN
jgi:hypothetical protein